MAPYYGRTKRPCCPKNGRMIKKNRERLINLFLDDQTKNVIENTAAITTNTVERIKQLQQSGKSLPFSIKSSIINAISFIINQISFFQDVNQSLPVSSWKFGTLLTLLGMWGGTINQSLPLHLAASKKSITSNKCCCFYCHCYCCGRCCLR